MYCDFCGKNLFYNVKYCRHCGRYLTGCSGDTQPLPIIDESILRSCKQERSSTVPWYKGMFKKQAPRYRSKGWRIFHAFLSCGILVALVYIIVTFQTMQEYQILIGMQGGLFATYMWWRG